MFISFAAVQYNDPDPYIWGPYYLLIAFICFLAFKNRYIFWLAASALAVTLFWAATYVPDAIDWVRHGEPNIAGAMKAETPYIENMREFLGLVICISVLGFLMLKNRRLKT